MSLVDLDSRASLGSDIECSNYASLSSLKRVSGLGGTWFDIRQVRVIVGKWGHSVRMSAPDLDIAVEGANFEEAWGNFLEEARSHPDSSWLTFDVGYTRPEEVSEGLDAPEDEQWNQTAEEGDNWA